MADMDWDDYDSDANVGKGKTQRRSAAGRKLMRWNPDIDQYVLLVVDMVCSEHGTPVPWDFVAERVNPTLTGEGIKQHLAKVRKYRYEAGRPVPERRRKIVAYGTGATTTPKKKGNTYVDATGKGAGLLWTDPKSKAPRQAKIKEEVVGPREPKMIEQKPKGTRKKAPGIEASFATPKTPAKKSRASTVKDEIEEKAFSSKKTTGKRGRTKKEPAIKEEDIDEYVEGESPTKKQRSLRRKDHVNYNEYQNAGDEDEDVFDARSPDDGDEGYGDNYYGSQPNTGFNSAGGSSHSSHKGYNTPVQPPPDFDKMMQSRTGMHAHEGPSSGEHQSSHFEAPFTGLNNNYGPGGYGGGGNMSMNPADMMHYHTQLTADQLQMHTQHADMGSYGNHQQDHLHYDEPTPPRKARKQSARSENDGVATPTGKKNKKKGYESVKQTKKEKLSRKDRKDSAHASDNSGEQQTGDFFTDEHFGNIPIVNDIGRGLAVSHGYGHSMPISNLALATSFDPQQGQGFTVSPADMMGGDFKHPITASAYGDNSTGITPNFNNFSFDSTTDIGADYAMPSTEGGAHMGFGHEDGGMGGITSMNSSFSSSNDTSAAGSQSDQTFPSVNYDSNNGLGFEDIFASGPGMGMDMGAGGHEDHDMFSFLNTESFH